MIFEKCRNTTSFDLKLYNQKINKCEHQTFLGIIFDNKLNFTKQIEKISDTCLKRLNIIKILAHKSWKLNSKTLVNIYLSLIRSIFDYSAILVPALSNSTLSVIQKIQNNAFRLIFNKPKDTRISSLHESARVDYVYDRFKKLSWKYITKALTYHNPIIKESYNEYVRYSNGRNLSTKKLNNKSKKLFY